jgi:hypothetical protein
LAATAIVVNRAGTVLYAGSSTNEGGTTNQLSAYLIAPDGMIGSSPAFPPVTADVDGLAVSPDGSEVATAYPGTSPIQPNVQIFGTGSDGHLTPGTQLAETCPTDVRFARTGGTLYSVGCAGSSGGTATLTSYTIGSSGSTPTLTQQYQYSPISSQTLTVAADGTIYVASPSAGPSGAQIQGVNLGTSGFTLGSAAPYPANLTITSMNVSPDSSQLFVASYSSSTTGTVHDFTIGSGDVLALNESIPIPGGLPSVGSISAACPGVGSVCVDTQNLQLTVNPGTITLSTPYTSSNPFVLPALTLSSDGTYFSSSATFPAATNSNAQQIVVTSTLAGDPGWSLSVAATNLSDGTGGTIASSGLGLTNGTLLNTGTFPGSVAFTNLPSHNPSPFDPDGNSGLGSTPLSWATSPAGDGTAVMDGVLTLLAPTSTPAGTYSGTITFSVS